LNTQIVINIKLIFELTLGLTMLASVVTGNPVTATSTAAETNNVPVEVSVKPDPNTNKKSISATEEAVREYFQDIPVLIDVVYCESRFVQLNPDGSVMRGRANPDDVGVMQINEEYHLATAQKLGINLNTLEGNMAYGRYLYKTFGTDPWVHSAPCWNKVREVAVNI
jgi:hypothetical protein